MTGAFCIVTFFEFRPTDFAFCQTSCPVLSRIVMLRNNYVMSSKMVVVLTLCSEIDIFEPSKTKIELIFWAVAEVGGAAWDSILELNC